ncbi:MAG: hypothetical protein MR280_06260, partial [Clostridium sp.]|nr:hypothetical protein [Clostridium sp.]
NRFYYTWRLFFRQYPRLAFSSPFLFLLKLSVSPGRTGGYQPLLDKRKDLKGHTPFQVFFCVSIAVGF